MPSDAANPGGPLDSIGLCASCRHRRDQPTRRGVVFHRCARADQDRAYLQYPPLPVLRCPGHEPNPEAASDD